MFIVVLKKGLVMGIKFLGNKSEIHTENSRNITLWNAFADMWNGFCFLLVQSSVITYAHLYPFPRLKGFS